MPTLYIAGYIILVIILFVIINLALRRGRNQNNKAQANVHKEPSEEAIMLNLAEKQEKIDTALLTDNKDLPQITEEEEEYKVDSFNLAEREKELEKKNAFPVVWTTSDIILIYSSHACHFPRNSAGGITSSDGPILGEGLRELQIKVRQ